MTLKLKGYARNPDGTPMTNKNALIYNSADSYLGGGGGVYANKLTQADGSWEFIDLDEATAYRVKVEAGSGSADKAVWDLFSGQVDELQVRTALRFAAGAGAVALPAGSTMGGTAISVGSHAHGGVYEPVHAHPYSLTSHAHGGVYEPVHAHPYSLNTHDHAAVYSTLAHTHAVPSGVVQMATGTYTGNNAGGRHDIVTVGGTPVLIMLWEVNGAGRGATWFHHVNSGITGFGVATGADEFLDATLHVGVFGGNQLLVNNNANAGVGANILNIIYGYLIFFV